jgi:hypothetical protein
VARPENYEFLALRTIDLTGQIDGHLEAVVFGPCSENRQL